MIVDKLLGIFKALKGDTSTEGRKKKGIIAAIAGSVALLIIAIVSFRAWKTGKKLAKLLHEKAVNEEKFIQAKVDKKIAISEKAKQAADDKIEDLHFKLVKITEAIQKAEDIFDDSKDMINEIKTWDDLEKFRGHL